MTADREALLDMVAASDAALLCDRARGAPIPQVEMIEDIYKIGFASGADWAIRKIKGDA